MLWKKESPAADALYVDLFKLCDRNLEVVLHEMVAMEKDLHPHAQKDDKIAVQQRLKGNARFRAGKWSTAMAYYNDSMCFVESGSLELMSFAYANRSACFLQLKMYEKCLNDIELAVAAGYPESKISTLDKRRAECLQRLQSGEQSRSIGATLSFPPDTDFPSLANVLRVEIDHTTGSTKVVAKQDIDVGRTIVAEDALFPYLSKQFGWRCNICLKGYENLTPCPNCAVAMFCSACKGHVLHEYECGLNMCGDGPYNRDVLHVVRKILSTIQIFGTIDEFMEFVEKHLQPSHGHGQFKQMLPTSLRDTQSRYQMYLNSASQRNADEFDILETASGIYPVFQTILRVPQIRAQFQTQKRLRFLMHYIGHCMSIRMSIARFGTIKQTDMPDDYDDNDPDVFATGYHQIGKYFKHSCYPNCLSSLGNGQKIVVTARPIKEGEQLFLSHVPFAIEPAKRRLNFGGMNLKCECVRCKGIMAKSMQRHNLSNDPVYLDLLSKAGQLNSNQQAINDGCVLLLQKYGHIDWCREIKIVLQMYQGALYNRLAGDVIGDTS